MCAHSGICVYVMHVLGLHVCVSDTCTCACRLKPEEGTGCPALSSSACSLVAGSLTGAPVSLASLSTPPPTPFLPGVPSGLNSSLHVSSANVILFLSCLSHPRHHSVLAQVIGESLSTSLVKINKYFKLCYQFVALYGQMQESVLC